MVRMKKIILSLFLFCISFFLNISTIRAETTGPDSLGDNPCLQSDAGIGQACSIGTFSGICTREEFGNLIYCEYKAILEGADKNNQYIEDFRSYCEGDVSESRYLNPDQGNCEDNEILVSRLLLPGFTAHKCCQTVDRTTGEIIDQPEDEFANLCEEAGGFVSDYLGNLREEIIIEGYEDETRYCYKDVYDEDIDPALIGIDTDTLNLTPGSLESLNPLQTSTVFSDPDQRTPGRIISEAMTRVVFPVAGLGLFILILYAGFQIISGSVTGKQTSVDLGKKRLTAAVVGFLLLFASYWLWQLLSLATGLL